MITLGEKAFRVLESLYVTEPTSFRAAVEKPGGFELGRSMRLFPMYHCGARILNTHRKYQQQERDWARVGKYLEDSASGSGE